MIFYINGLGRLFPENDFSNLKFTIGIIGSQSEGSAQVVEMLILNMMPGAHYMAVFEGATCLIWRAKMRIPMMPDLWLA
jgi:hypothetical protein